MASITVTFFVCWSPMVVYGFVHDFYREALPERDRWVSMTYRTRLKGDTQVA